MTRKPNVLVVGYCYPPTASPEAFVTAKLLRNIPDCSIDVLTVENGLVNGFLDEEMGEYAGKISGRVHRVKAPTLVQKLCSFPRLPLRPDRWTLLNHAVQNRAESLLQDKYDCVVTRSQYHSAHLVGLHLKKRHPNLPWIACFSDPWSRADHQSKIPVFSQWSDFQEKKVLKSADHLLFPTTGLRDHFTKFDEHLNSKSSILPHSFDPNLYDDKRREYISKKPSLTLRLFGSFYGSRNPDALIAAIGRLNDEKRNVSLEVFGEWHPLYKKNKNLVTYMGKVRHIDALSKMQDADLLVVVDAPGSGNSFYLPSKLVDYLGSQQPILSLCRPGIVQEVTLNVGGIVADPSDINDIVRVLRTWMDSRGAPALSNKAFSKSYESSVVGTKFRSLIDRVICGREI